MRVRASSEHEMSPAKRAVFVGLLLLADAVSACRGDAGTSVAPHAFLIESHPD